MLAAQVPEAAVYLPKAASGRGDAGLDLADLALDAPLLTPLNGDLPPLLADLGRHRTQGRPKLGRRLLGLLRPSGG
jgi:hypothetical protein